MATAGGDLKVESEKVWAEISELGLPRIAFVSRLDRERTSFDHAMADLEKSLDAHPVALTLPIGAELTFNGVIDVLAMKALIYAEANGKPREEALSAEQKERAETARTRLCEAVAETDDALLEKYLDKGVLEDAELRAALRAATVAGKLTPVLCGSGLKNIGIGPLLDAIDALLPAPNERPARQGFNVVKQRSGRARAGPGGALFRLRLQDLDRSVRRQAVDLSRGLGPRRQRCHGAQLDSRLARAFRPAFAPGRQEAVANLKRAAGRDSRGRQAQRHHYRRDVVRRKITGNFPGAERPAPVISFAIRPKTKGDEQKASQALQHLVEEDRALETHRDPQTHEIILSGTGQMHIEVTVEKLRRKFNVDVELQPPKVPYKETIKGRAEAQGKYKRQSGGRGQYGDCWLKVEPLPRGGGFEFKDEIVGGAIPRQFIPSVEKGVRNTLVEGHLAGFPVVDIKVSVFEGSYHDVDSSDMAFQIAASMGLKAAFEKARPIILEPVMALDVSCPDECMGDVIGDLNARRGKVLGMDRKGHSQVIKALVPMSEVLKYAPDLRSKTSGRGSFESHFSHYEEAPPPVTEKIVREAREAREAAQKERAHA